MKRKILKFVCAILMILIFPIVAVYEILDELYTKMESKQEGQNEK